MPPPSPDLAIPDLKLAHCALVVERQIGLLVPCNVVVRQGGDGVIVEALDASIIAPVPGNPALDPVLKKRGELEGQEPEGRRR